MTATNDESSADKRAPERVSATVSGSRRRAERAIGDEPAPSLAKVLWENPREPALVGLGGLLGLGWGVSTAVAPGPGLGRVLGTTAAVAGTLVLVSYVLRFFPIVLRGERWFSTRPRRAGRLVLKYAWGFFLGVAFLAWVVGFFVDH